MSALVRRLKMPYQPPKQLVEVTYTVKALLMVGNGDNAHQMAKKCRGEILSELGSSATVDLDTFEENNWSKDFVPYGNNPDEMPLSSFLIRSDETDYLT